MYAETGGDEVDPQPFSATVGREIVEDFLKWKVVSVEGRTILWAIDLHEKHK